jgi:crotonobetainyl-CoA:carnitine CoA-transferase CaiB-like acyl-CoA transferase
VRAGAARVAEEIAVTACVGIRVLEIAEGFGAASLCGQLLAGLSAKVVKLESAGGDPLRREAPFGADATSLAFHILNANKSSAVLKAGAERQSFDRLARWSDVIVVDPKLRIGSLSYGPTAMAAAYPDKIVCTMTPFGTQGERAHWLGSELIVEAIGGLMACTGYPERPPVMSGIPYAQHVQALFGFAGIMAALWERERSGRGQYLDLAAVDCLVALLGNFMPAYFLSGRSPKRIGNRHTIAAPWNLYPTADGQVVICTGTGGTSWWGIVTKAIGRPELGADERYDTETKRVQRVEEVDAIVSAWTKPRTMAEVVTVMTECGIPASEVAAIEAVLADPHYSHTRSMTVRLPGQVDVAIPGLPIKVGAWTPPAVPAPVLGSFPVDLAEPRAAPNPGPSTAQHPDGALAGIRILEFGSRTSVPMAGRFLSDLGADVVKIEPEKGESLRGAGQQIGGASYLFQINNGGKRGIVVEPNDPRGRELILELAAKADVWMENLAPGTLDARGLGYDALKAVNSRIIYCSISGFGIKSEYGRKKALDTVVQAASGTMSTTGYADHLPVKLGISAVDLSVAVALIGAVASALRTRERTGQGQHIDIAMADIGCWMTQAAWPSIVVGNSTARLGNRSRGDCPHNLFATREGFLAIAVETDEQWIRLVKLLEDASLDDPTLATASGRLGQLERVEASVSRWAAALASERAAEMCQAAGVPAAPVRSLADVVTDRDVVLRGLIPEVDHPVVGKLRLLGTPLRLSRTPAKVRHCAPLLGEHTREVLQQWLGFSDEQIRQLKHDGVIAWPGRR